MSTTTRTLIGFLLLIAGAFYLFLDRLTDRVERQYMEAAEEPMVDTAHLLASVLEPEFRDGDLRFENFRTGITAAHRRQFEARIYNLVKREVGMNVYVTDRQGIVLYDSRNGKAEGKNYIKFNDVARTLAGIYGARSSRLDENRPETSIMHVGAPIHVAGEIVGVATVIKPQSSMFAFIEETIERIHFYGWSIMLATMLTAILVSHWFASPIRRLTEFARSVCRGERTAMPKFASADVRTLAVALDDMRDSLEDRKYVEQYVQTLTHEMKSPVAAIRGAVELLNEGRMNDEQRTQFLGNIASETDRIQSSIDRLLALASIESMKALSQPEPVDLTALIQEVLATHQHAITTRKLDLDTRLAEKVIVHGESFLLETAIANLLQNAIDFSPEGQTITVVLEAFATTENVRLTISNQGPTIPDYALKRIFDRFYSLTHPATGKKSSGLGLCFVRESIELHGGTAIVENHADGTGVRATIELKP